MDKRKKTPHKETRTKSSNINIHSSMEYQERQRRRSPDQAEDENAAERNIHKTD
jgi:hypothetical protein